MRVFISHSSSDKKFVRTLKDDLELNGIQTWFDEDELDYGDSLVEKLETAIEQSTHFIIILSPNSIDSDWVKIELSKAKLLKDQSTLKKIIPIKYRECDLPSELKDLLYGDLSDEVVIQADNEKVKFTSDGYPKFFNKLIKTIKSGDKQLTADDKVKLKKQVETIEQKDEEITSKLTPQEISNRTTVRFLLRVIGYKDKTQVAQWRNHIKTKTEIDKIKNLSPNDISPIILPSTLQLYKADFKLGEEITIKNKYLYEFTVHFGGYKTKSDTYSIAISGTARQNLHIEPKKVYLFEFDLKTKQISIV